MALNLEIYQPVKCRAVTGNTYNEVQGTPIPCKQLPFQPGHIPLFSQVIVEENVTDNTSNRWFRRTSPSHGRSYEFLASEEGSIIFSDEYGNIYTSLTTKGNNLTNPIVGKSEITPSRFDFYGLQDSDSMVRALRASELLRSNGVATELFVKVIEPLELPYKDEVIPLDEFKRRLVRQIWEEDVNHNGITRDDIPRLATVLNNMTFFITVRGMQVPERINDLIYTQSKQDIDRMMTRAFRYINLDEQRNAKLDPEYTPRVLSTNDDITTHAYFTLHLPERIAKNLAKMHKLGLVHMYPHIGNVSTVGSIYDLDSIRGEPLELGDDPITKEDIMHDAMEFIYGHGNWHAPFELARLFRVENGEEAFRGIFLDTYVREMGWVGNIEHLGDVAEVWKDFDNKQHLNAINLYLEEIFKEQKIDFEYDITPQEVAEFIVGKLPIPGGEMEVVDKDNAPRSETTSQAALAVAIFTDILREAFEAYFKERGFDKRVTDEQLATFFEYFDVSNLMKVNEAIAESANQIPEGEAEHSFWQRKKEKYVTKPKSEKIQGFEQEFLVRLVGHWGWDENISANLNKIKALFEDNGIKFEGELERFYIELNNTKPSAQTSTF